MAGQHIVVLETDISYQILYVTTKFRVAQTKLRLLATKRKFNHIRSNYYSQGDYIMRIRSSSPNLFEASQGVSTFTVKQMGYLNTIQSPIMKSQWNDLYTPDNASPEHRLAFAILKDAILVKLWNKNKTNLKVRTKRLKEDTDQWFASDAVDHVFSFRSICDLLDFNADAIREELERRTFTKKEIRHITIQEAVINKAAA